MDQKWWINFLKGMLKPVAALTVVFLAVALSRFKKLEIEGEMIYSIFRAFLQLSIIGFVLQFIFNQGNISWIILAYLFMVSFSISDLIHIALFFYSVSIAYYSLHSLI